MSARWNVPGAGVRMTKQAKFASSARPGRVRSRFTEEDVASILREHAAGTPMSEISRKHRISTSTFYRWKAKADAAGRAVRRRAAPGLKDEAKPLGRPAGFSADDIVRAALGVGLERATIRSVAKALGMSPTGLYHHFRTREQLVNFVTDSVLADILMGAPDDESFEGQILYYARRLYNFFADHPQAVTSMMAGHNFFTPRMIPVYEKLLSAAVKKGLGVAEAYEIWQSVNYAAIGAAATEATVRAAGARALFLPAVKATFEQSDIDAPQFRALVEAQAGFNVDYFDRVRLVLEGVRAKFIDKE